MSGEMDAEQYLLDRLTPDEVICVESFGPGAAGGLRSDEGSFIEGSVESRQHEFAAVRSCAREALGALGAPVGSILPGLGGAPVWPDGVVGSMTHCAGFRAAAVAPSWRVYALGIDAEVNERLPDGVASDIADPSEWARLDRLPDRGVAWDRLLFSAKESTFKCWYPATHRWVGFSDIVVDVDVSGSFEARLSPGLARGAGFPRGVVRGRWGFLGTIVATAVVL
jgi:4'-phosphopantetheinyl transferase EntD